MKKLMIIFTVIFSICVLSGCNSNGAGGGKEEKKEENNTNNNGGGGSGNGGGSGGGGNSGSVIGTKKQFWAQKATDNSWYSLTAELLAANSRCEVWVEQGSGINTSTAQNAANIYNSNYTKMINNFGNTFDTGNGLKDTMQLADWWLGNNDGKLCILLLDIIDDYSEINNAYVAGYFDSNHLFQGNNSNERDMIFIDTKPGLQDNNANNAYSTLFHEMQHLMNFTSTLAIRSYIVGNEVVNLNEMDLWIDEGLSSAAEWVYLGNHNNGRLGWYNDDPTNLIEKGNNFFLWGNRAGENANAVLDDYATVYLFFQWLRLQTGSSSIYKNIIVSDFSDYRAVVSNAKSIASDWETLLRNWYAANYIKSGTGLFGYMNDTILNGVTVHYAPAADTINLFAGEGVYSVANSFTVPSSQTGNIRYSGLNNTLIEAGSSVTGALLTYNVNIVKSTNKGIQSSSSETGTTTGIAANTQISGGRSVQGTQINKPFPISFSDMLRRNGHTGNNSVKSPLFLEIPDER